MKRMLLTLLASALLTANAKADESDYEVISTLEIYDTESHTRSVVREFHSKIEAPNWTPDGKWLVFNSQGRLYRLSVSDPSICQEIDTRSADGCNNDHVISSDGKWIALSDKWPSMVYRVPFKGGEPELLTQKGPSYLHGWSHDMNWIAYCAFRNDELGADIYVKRLDENEEHQLTDAPGLDDGPEYSPDDKHIWFNSVRTGLMQVWRMNADGTEQTQMTFDEDLNSWFPHISPDGQKVVYIAYHKGDLEPGEHLPNKNVLLRMMPAEGGEPTTIVELFGGQGTINVNSWAPDSRKFAFVSYRLKNSK